MEKRKRSSEEDNILESPSRKLYAVSSQSIALSPCQAPPLPLVNNPNELALDSELEDEESDPQTSPGPGPITGPSCDDKPCCSESEVEAKPEKKRIFGPTAPPPNSNREPAECDENSSDSDDDFGPSLPPLSISEIEPSSSMQLKEDFNNVVNNVEPNSTCKLQRAEWMLAPPTSSDWTNRIDPTKLKNRKFASGKGAQASTTQTNISNIWTETHDEKRQRLEDEVLGRCQTPSSSAILKTAQTRLQEREAEATDQLIREYNEKNRSRSLMKERELAQAQGKLKKEEDDDPSKRGFDREKDMALGGRMGIVKKRELINRAADFSSRFEKGKYL